MIGFFRMINIKLVFEIDILEGKEIFRGFKSSKK